MTIPIRAMYLTWPYQACWGRDVRQIKVWVALCVGVCVGVCVGEEGCLGKWLVAGNWKVRSITWSWNEGLRSVWVQFASAVASAPLDFRASVPV